MESAAALVVAASLPGLAAWWLGRGVSRADPALVPERLAVMRRRSLAVTVACLVFCAWPAGPLAPVLAIVSHLAGGWPLRRSLFGERSTPSAYVASALSRSIGLAGFWLAMLGAPSLVAASDSHVVAAALLALFALWNAFSLDVMAFFVGARAADPALLAVLEPVASRAAVRPDRILVTRREETAFANAFAAAGHRGTLVVLGRTLVERLAPGELAAIHAHELAHLEEFRGAYLRRLMLLSWAAVLLAVVPVWAARALVPTQVWIAAAVSHAALVLLVVWRASGQQRHETHGDLRAAQLCGDPETLATALEKLYRMNAAPRRLDLETEAASTHPSLARRLQAIRALAVTSGSPAQAPGAVESVIVESARAGAWVVLEGDRVHLLEKVEAGDADLASLRARAKRMRSEAYEELASLRVDAGPPATLVAMPREGERWSVPLREGDVARVQQVLDRVDARLGRAKAVPANPVLVRVSGLLAMALALAAGLPLVIVALGGLAVFRTGRTALALLAGASVGAALVLLARGDVPLLPIASTIALAVVTLLVLVRGASADAEPGADRIALAVAILSLGAAVLGPALSLASGPSLARLHSALRDGASLAPSLFALAAAVAMHRGRRMRAAAIMLAAVASGVLAIGSSTFADRVVRDPLVARAAPGFADFDAIEDGTPVEFEGAGYLLRLSPDGTRFAATIGVGDDEEWGPEDDAPQALRQVMGAFGGGPFTVEANELQFSGPDRVVTLRFERGATILSAHSVESSGLSAPEWTLRVAHAYGGLVVDPESGALAISRREQGETVVVLTARIGDAEPKTTRLGGLAPGHTIALAQGTTLNHAMHFEARGLNGSPLLGLFGAPRFTQRLSVVSPDSRTDLPESSTMLGCVAAEGSARAFLCLASSAEGAVAWRIDPAGARAEPIAALDARASRPLHAGAVATAVAERIAHVVDVSGNGRNNRRVALPDDAGWDAEADVAGDVLAVLRRDGAKTSVKRYRIAR